MQHRKYATNVMYRFHVCHAACVVAASFPADVDTVWL